MVQTLHLSDAVKPAECEVKSCGVCSAVLGNISLRFTIKYRGVDSYDTPVVVFTQMIALAGITRTKVIRQTLKAIMFLVSVSTVFMGS